MPYYAVPALRGRRVLVVDDIEINRRILRHYVELWGMIPIETESSREALVWVERGDPFDIALLDYMMPDLDGVQLSHALRALRTETQLPILILSSASDELPAIRGVAEAMTKPIKPSRLLEAVSRALAQAPAAPRAETTAFHLPRTLGVDHPLRILVAEDNAMNQKLAKLLFGKMGYDPDFVGDGREAVLAVSRQTYDVVFMDVLMPVMDGLDATRDRSLAWPATDRPRIVGMSANAMTEDQRTATEAGMDDYVPKPVPVDLLVAALKRCVRRP
ncbi:MAG: response regulator [Proteobacteria bacterium]|nr:MAG: response regulator [Pseudomonadota bacterium]